MKKSISVNFLSLNDYIFLNTLKDNFQIILDEFNTVEDISSPWYLKESYGGPFDTIMFRWILRDITKNQLKFPKLISLINNISDYVFTYGYGILRPGSEIYEDVGENVETLRCYLCLSTNDDCAITVNGEVKKFAIGDIVIFDDVLPYSFYNKGQTDAVFLSIDFYKNFESLPK